MHDAYKQTLPAVGDRLSQDYVTDVMWHADVLMMMIMACLVIVFALPTSLNLIDA